MLLHTFLIEYLLDVDVPWQRKPSSLQRNNRSIVSGLWQRGIWSTSDPRAMSHVYPWPSGWGDGLLITSPEINPKPEPTEKEKLKLLPTGWPALIQLSRGEEQKLKWPVMSDLRTSKLTGSVHRSWGYRFGAHVTLLTSRDVPVGAPSLRSASCPESFCKTSTKESWPALCAKVIRSAVIRNSFNSDDGWKVFRLSDDMDRTDDVLPSSFASFFEASTQKGSRINKQKPRTSWRKNSQGLFKISLGHVASWVMHLCVRNFPRRLE